MKQAEGSGRTVEEAVDQALSDLGVSREDVEVEVLDPGTRGMLGLGARDARVRVTLRANPAAVAHTLMERLLAQMGMGGTVRAREQDDTVMVQITGERVGALIGRRGATLDAIQFLLGLMVARKTRTRVRVVVDIEGYRERRQMILADLARKIAERVARDGREVALEPMDASDRRIVHTTLAGHPKVTTFSRGEGAARQVVVAPKTEEREPGEGVRDD